MPSQSARSRALASAVESPTTRTDLEVWDEIKFVLDTMTSKTGPLSSPKRTQNVHLKKKLCELEEFSSIKSSAKVSKIKFKDFIHLILKIDFCYHILKAIEQKHIRSVCIYRAGGFHQ